MKPEPMVMSDSPEAAKQVTITGWVSRDGRFYGDDERIARYAGCTHRPCEECKAPTEKSYTHCSECRHKREVARYWALPAAPWDGHSMIFADANDEYFHDMESFLEHCEDEGIEPGDLRPLLCAPNIASQVDPDYWQDDMAEDGDLPGELEDALRALNKIIQEGKFVLSWSASKTRLALDSPSSVKTDGGGEHG
jgi:hypothetical protein